MISDIYHAKIWNRYPDSVTVKDIAGSGQNDGTSTPAEEPDFFTDFDKPMIKRPTPPISRTGTPGVGRTPSPFLSAGNGNGINRAPSPLGADKAAAPAASRTTSSAALRKSAIGAGPRKANVLGAKKTKLGAKKVTGEVIDFDAAEKKAKEEAERIEKLGYDPEAEEAATKKVTAAKSELPKIASPTPLSPGRAGFGSTQSRERTDGELERLGMGMGRLGFGQVGGSKPAQPAAKKMGFGSVGSTKIAQEGNSTTHPQIKPLSCLQLLTKSSLTQPTTKNTPAKNSVRKKAFLRTNSSTKAPLTHQPKAKPRLAFKVSRAPAPSHPTPTSVVRRPRAVLMERITEIWRLRLRIS